MLFFLPIRLTSCVRVFCLNWCEEFGESNDCLFVVNEDKYTEIHKIVTEEEIINFRFIRRRQQSLSPYFKVHTRTQLLYETIEIICFLIIPVTSIWQLSFLFASLLDVCIKHSTKFTTLMIEEDFYALAILHALAHDLPEDIRFMRCVCLSERNGTTHINTE